MFVKNKWDIFLFKKKTCLHSTNLTDIEQELSQSNKQLLIFNLSNILRYPKEQTKGHSISATRQLQVFQSATHWWLPGVHKNTHFSISFNALLEWEQLFWSAPRARPKVINHSSWQPFPADRRETGLPNIKFPLTRGERHRQVSNVVDNLYPIVLW